MGVATAGALRVAEASGRRHFLKLLGLSAAGLVLPTTRYFFAPPGGWRADGISIRFVRQWQAETAWLARYDVIYGVAIVQPELGTRLVGIGGVGRGPNRA